MPLTYQLAKPSFWTECVRTPVMRRGSPRNPTLFPKLPPRRSRHEGSSVLDPGYGSQIFPRVSAFLWTDPHELPTPSGHCGVSFILSQRLGAPPTFQSLPDTASKVFLYTPQAISCQTLPNSFQPSCFNSPREVSHYLCKYDREKPHGPVAELNLSGSGRGV